MGASDADPGDENPLCWKACFSCNLEVFLDEFKHKSVDEVKAALRKEGFVVSAKSLKALVWHESDVHFCPDCDEFMAWGPGSIGRCPAAKCDP